MGGMPCLLSQKLKKQKIITKLIEKSSQIILREEHKRYWKDPQFRGHSRRLRNQFIRYFKVDKEKFAKAGWGNNWKKSFPDDSKRKEQQKQISQCKSKKITIKTKNSLAKIYFAQKVVKEIAKSYSQLKRQNELNATEETTAKI